mgnify:CR=1 FL=1
MANMRAIRTRIKSVESTRQITKSMKMVAASKLRRTQDSMAALRPFAETSRRMLAHVAATASGAECPLLVPHEGERICYVLFVGNRGLCGMYNSALVKYLEELAKGKDCFLVVSGRWGREVIAASGIPVKKTFDAASDTPDSAEARELAGYLRELYLGGEADKVVLVYEHYKSALAQVPVNLQLLPVVAGVSYEVLKGLAHSESRLAHALRWPGMQMQRLTTNPPDEGMLECAITAMKLVVAREELEAAKASQPASAKAMEPRDEEQAA